MLEQLLKEVSEQEEGNRRRGWARMQLEQLQEEPSNIKQDINESQCLSKQASQVLSVNELGESWHPMILSNINNPRYNHLSLLRIRNATSELRQTQLDLLDFLEQQATAQQELRHQMAEDFTFLLTQISNRTVQPSKSTLEELRFKQKALKSSQTEREKLQEALRQAEQRIDKLVSENQKLQEHIFDIEQRIVGVELQVDRRLKERGRQAEKQAAAAAREAAKEENRQIVAQLQAEIAALRQKCASLQSDTQPSQLREKEYQVGEAEIALALKEENIDKELAELEVRKQETYQREQELMSAQENLSKKISELRKKQAELSQWQAQLTRRDRIIRVGKTEMPSNEQSLDELNQSGEVSLKSFGRHNIDEPRIAPTSLQQLGARRLRRTLNNAEQPQSVAESIALPQNSKQLHNHQRKVKQMGESAYVTKREVLEQGRRYNVQLSQYREGRESRQASPYNALKDLKGKGNAYSHLYTLPRASPKHDRQVSRHSRSSVSRNKTVNISTKQEESGLGSKLQRLREEIKKEIESIK